MKNKLQIIFAFVGIAMLNFSIANAQSLQFINTQTELSAVIPTAAKSHAEVKNISENTLQVRISVTPISLAEGHYFSVCSPITCAQPTNKKFASEKFSMAPGEIISGDKSYTAIVLNMDNDFDGTSDAKPGISVLKIKYINIDNEETDFIEYTVTYTVTEGSGIVSETWVRNTDVFPNPSTDKVVLRIKEALNTNCTLKVYNEVGDLVVTNELSSGNTTFDVNTNNLTSGNYHFAIESNNSVINSGSFTVVK